MSDNSASDNPPPGSPASGSPGEQPPSRAAATLSPSRAVTRSPPSGAATALPRVSASAPGDGSDLSLPSRAATTAGEVVVAFGAAALSVYLSRSIVVNPLDRVGQVSGVAGLDLHFVVLGLLVLAVCAVAARVGRTAWEVIRCCACAAVAGLASGLVAGGILLALRGTDWPLYAGAGDSGQLILWAEALLAGRPVPPDYPPLIIHLIAWVSELTGDPPAGALRTLQIAGVAVFGPIAYLSWRLLLGPTWALGVALVAALPLLEPYKPYTTVVLVALVPVVIALLATLRRAAGMTWLRVVATGIGAGAVLGALFCAYSGWFLWSAPGALTAMLLVFPWRTAALRGLVLLGLAATTLVVVAAPHLFGIIRAAGTVKDRYFYFDTFVDPAYIAMWRNDLAGDPGPWPPPGELGGVGVFTVLLIAGLGIAVALGGRRTSVLTIGCLLAGAWVLRFWIASQMFATQTVQLYPRTTAEILFCLLLLSILAVRLGIRRLADLAERWTLPVLLGGNDGHRRPRISGTAATMGSLSAALLLALAIGSATADRYMPRNDGSVGLLSYTAQMVRQANGTCPDYSGPTECAATVGELVSRGPG